MEGEADVDQGLGLVLGGVLLGVGIEDRPQGLSRLGQRDLVHGFRPRQEPGDDPVAPLVDRRRGSLPEQAPAHRFEGGLARLARGVGLPAGDVAFARLAGRAPQVNGLVHGLKDRLHRQPQQGADPGRDGRGEMGHVVDLVLVQADAPDQGDLRLVGHQEAAHQVGPSAARLLGRRQHPGDRIRGMGVVGGQEAVVVIQLAHGHAVGQGRPLAVEGALRRQAVEAGPRPLGWG